MEDKNLLLALSLKNNGGGGGGSGLPDVTAEDNGKTLQVEEGNWQVKNAEYTQKKVFFSGNATVVETRPSLT